MALVKSVGVTHLTNPDKPGRNDDDKPNFSFATRSESPSDGNEAIPSIAGSHERTKTKILHARRVWKLPDLLAFIAGVESPTRAGMEFHDLVQRS